MTTRVRFATNILLAALRRPVVLAKMAATIDVLSDGRLDLGVGIGWQREEYEAAGLSYERRGSLLNHTIEVCQALWRHERVNFESDELAFSGIHQMPKPTQARGVPIWTSGTVNARSMDRLATYGSGWIPWGDDAADVEGGIERMRRAVTDRGRDPLELGVVGNLRAVKDTDGNLDLVRTMEPVPRLHAAGVTDFRIVLQPPAGFEPASDYMGSIVAAFRRGVRLNLHAFIRDTEAAILLVPHSYSPSWAAVVRTSEVIDIKVAKLQVMPRTTRGSHWRPGFTSDSPLTTESVIRRQ